MAISANKWRQRYSAEVERQIAYYEELNRNAPTIIRQLTPEEKIEMEKRDLHNKNRLGFPNYTPTKI